MKILTAKGLQYLSDCIKELEKLSPSTSTSSTSSNTEKSLSEKMLSETMLMLDRLQKNNELSYWQTKNNHQDLVNWFHLLDNQQYTFVPVVFDKKSREFAGVVLTGLRGIDLESQLEATCRLALKSVLTLSGGDAGKMIKTFADNLALNITLYDMVDEKERRLEQIQQLKKEIVLPIENYLDQAVNYLGYLQGKNKVNPKHIQQFRETLMLPDSCTALDDVKAHIIQYYRSNFMVKLKQLVEIDIPYSTILNIDDVIKCSHPRPVIVENKDGIFYQNNFADMGFMGNKSLLLRSVAMLESDLEKLLDVQLNGLRQLLIDAYQTNKAEAIFAEFKTMTEQLLADIDNYIDPPMTGSKSVGFFSALKSKAMMDADKKAIATRLQQTCVDSIAEGEATEKMDEFRKQTISTRCFNVFKGLLCESNIHAGCVGAKGISFGRLGDIFNQYIPLYYALFSKIDLSNDAYVQVFLKLQPNLVVPGQKSADTHAVSSTSTTSMTNK